MLGPVDYALWLAGFALEAAVVVCIFYCGAFRRYFAIALYMGCTFVVQGAQYLYFLKFGIKSREYFYFYYSSDTLLTVLLFFVVIHLYEVAFAGEDVGRYIYGGASLLFFLAVAFAYLAVRHGPHVTQSLVIEVGQDLYFIGTVLTYTLWGAIMKRRASAARLVQVVLALGVYFSATAGAYALRDLFPELQRSGLNWIPPIAGVWLPAAWTVAFLKTREEEGLVTSGMTVESR